MNELLDLLTLDIPEAPPRELGFLDVVDHNTRETTICNVYRYFLDRELSPQISPLMVEALKKLLVEKGFDREIDLSDHEVHTEWPTKKGRIDIVLESKVSESVVIIEAKVYHWLHNDLEDYWNAFEFPESHKVGILLSLESMTREQIGNKHFINITHSEWLNSVCALGLPSNLRLRDYIYFNDFVNNMDYLTHSVKMNEQAKFYFQHRASIEKAVATQKEASKYILINLQHAVEELGLELTRDKLDWSHIKQPKIKNYCRYTIFPRIVLLEGKLKIHLELKSPTETELQECRHHISNNYEELNLVIHNGSPKALTPVATLEVNLSLDDLSDFKGLINKWLLKLEPIREDLNQFAPPKYGYSN